MELINSHGQQTGIGEDPAPSVTHFYRGSDPSAWREAIPNYRAVRFQAVFPGIDLRWRGHAGTLEYEFLVGAGADPGRIRLRFHGARTIRVDSSGDLVVKTAAGQLRYRHPVAYQEAGRRHHLVEIGFRLSDDTVDFHLGAYDHSRPLRIDPTLNFSSYLGGSGFDAAYGITADSVNHVCVTGETASSDFPAIGGSAGVSKVDRDAFVTCLSADGTALIYTTILSGTGNDSGKAIAAGSDGGVYVSGVAGGLNFPVTSGVVQSTAGGAGDAFVAHLNSSGRLVYSTYLGGGGADFATGIAADASGNAYVSGYTSSLTFPTTSSAPQTSYQGGFYDAFLTKLNSSGSAILYSTLLGGAGNDIAMAVAVDSSGEACITGSTDSISLPVVKPVQTHRGIGTDAFVACLNQSGTAWNLMTYLGGSTTDQGYGIALDTAGNAYLSGSTYSSDFPTTSGAYQTTRRPDYDAFVTKLNIANGTLVYSTLLGGSGADTATAVTLDSSDDAWVVGYTVSSDFPQVNGLQTGTHGNFEAFVSELNSTGTTLLFSSYLGGSSDDRAWGVALDVSGNVLVTGYTASTDFPTTSGVLQARGPAPYNAFIARIGVTPGPTVISFTPSAGTGASQTFTLQVADAAGAGSISNLQLQFNDQLFGASTCRVYYAAWNRGLYLLDDANQSWLGPAIVGRGATLQNSRCAVNAATASATLSGNTLTVSIPLTFTSAFGGNKNVYLQAYDASNYSIQWQTIGTWTLPQNLPPAFVGLTPNSGTGMQQVFRVQVSDASGASAMASLQLQFSDQLYGASNCRVYYAVSNNGLYVLDDASQYWIGPSTVGSGATLQNSRCSVNPVASSVSTSGNVITVNFSISFTASFAGTKAVFLEAWDNANLHLSWLQIGIWTTSAPNPPTFVALTPNSGSGAQQTFVVQVADADGATSIANFQLQFANQLFGATNCRVYYAAGNNGLYVLDDLNQNWLGPSTVGSGSTIQNSHCAANPQASSVSLSGTVLTAYVSITFASVFAGAKNVYMEVWNNANQNLAWAQIGSWTVTP